MILFHTSDRIIKSPDLNAGRSNADFGRGFYLSADSGFAGAWARERRAADICVNRYVLDPCGLSIKVFEISTEWFRYIFGNRNGEPDSLGSYDVITGPVANDTLFETYGIVTSGLLTEKQALELLMIGPEYTQTVIKTPKGLSNLKWGSAFTPDPRDLEAAKLAYAAQSAGYESAFTEALGKMDIGV